MAKDPALTSLQADKGTMNVKPDGFLRIREKAKDGSVAEHVFFLEVDRSTEVLDIIATRAACYLA